jgi:acetyltransferase
MLASEIFATAARLSDGTPVALRPIRPGDGGLIQEIARHMTADDLRQRFFSPMRALSRELAEQLARIDYRRGMALVATTAGGEMGLGAGRFVIEPEADRAEFALGVRSDWQGRGLGRLFLERLAEIAAARGVSEIYGLVLRDNERIIGLARSMGYRIAAYPDDATLVRVVKPLAAASW